MSNRQKLQKYSSLYSRHADDLDRLQTQLFEEIPNLIAEFEVNEEGERDLVEYVNDRVSLFRFLKKASYNFASTRLSLLSTLRWRLENKVNEITLENLHPRFANSSLVSFEGEDMLGRPILVLRLREWLANFEEVLQDDDSDEEDRNIYVQHLCIFILEIIRRRTWILASERHQSSEISQSEASLGLALHCTVLLDLHAARFKYETTTLTTLLSLFKTRYPSCIAQVFVLNYSWTYAGLWGMLKMVLTEEARERIVFIKDAEEMKECVGEEIVRTKCWAMEKPMTEDVVIRTRGGSTNLIPPSISSMSLSSEVFFDAFDQSPHHSTPSTPFYTPLPSPRLVPSDSFNLLPLTPLNPIKQQSRSRKSTLSHSSHKPVLLTPRETSSLGTISPAPSLVHNAILRRIPSILRRIPTSSLSRRASRITTLFYWVLAFVLIRGGSGSIGTTSGIPPSFLGNGNYVIGSSSENLLLHYLGGFLGRVIELVVRAGLGRGLGMVGLTAGGLGIGDGAGVLVAGV